MALTPRYITVDQAVEWLVNKVTFDLIDSLPQPDTVTPTDEGVSIIWNTRPPYYNQFSPIANGTNVTQGDAYGNYGGKNIDPSIFGIYLTEVTGTFSTSGGEMAVSEDPNAISLPLLNSLIAQAEAKVEFDLSDLYIIPFQSVYDGIVGDYEDLPPTSLATLQELFLCQTSLKVMRLGFGKSDGNRGDTYVKEMKELYASQKTTIFTRARTGNLKQPPLPNLLQNVKNIKFDRVPGPRAINDDRSGFRFGQARLNNPSRTPFLMGPWPGWRTGGPWGGG